mgnify:CR=1 FL=1
MVWDPIWEKLFSSRDWGKYPSEELIRFMAQNYYQITYRNQIKILELGCGPGANLWYLAREGFMVYGMDGSSTAIEKCRKRLDSEVPGWIGDLYVGDIISLPYDNNFFDAVIDLEAITHNSFEDSKRIYSEAARVLKSKGKIFSRTFSVGTWGDKTGKNLGHNAWNISDGPMKDHCEYIRFTALDEINDLLINFNLEKVELLKRTLDNRAHEIKEWLIYGEKI